VQRGKIMNKYSIDEIMEMAIQTEKLGYQFYTGMADKFKKDAGLVNLFTTLASKEKTHERTFTNLRDAVAKNGTEPVQWEEVTNYMRAFVESEFFLGKGKSLPAMDHLRTVQDAVKFALGFEKETLLYFMELRSIVKEKAAVDGVIDEEKSHIVWLDKFRKEMTKN
jgi:rubrerythrin